MAKKKTKKKVEHSEDFTLEALEQELNEIDKKAKKKKIGSRKRTKAKSDSEILSYRHQDKRKNNPEVGMVKPENDPAQPKTKWNYDPHLDPALQFDMGRSQVEKLIDDALESGDEKTMQNALEELKRLQQPYLNWAGKAEKMSFELDTVSLHVHERIDPASILSTVRRKMKDGKKDGMQPDMFAAPFENMPLRDAIDFYKHERGWANRIIAGDSLLVMNSLLQKEGMAGQVQMFYIDPPYGIKYGSNFQPFVNKRDVKDRKDDDLTQEPEMIKAFRDTWELGIHSYLTYLRDRLLLSRELLHDSGSVFIQISDENLHHVRGIMDEIFGKVNFVCQITFQKTGSIASNYISSTVDYIVWYAKNKKHLKYRPLFLPRTQGENGLDRYDMMELTSGEIQRIPAASIRGDESLPDGKRCRLTTLLSDGEPSEKKDFTAFNKNFPLRSGKHWKTDPQNGGQRLLKAGRIIQQGNTVWYKRYVQDFPVLPISDRWDSMQIGRELNYVVQTSSQVIERCMQLTTDPSDLVLDPTCGSGTTAYVAEKWGRRWITTDTSRVAVSLAKQRLMIANYDYYVLRYPQEGLKSGFIYKTVPHVTLKSIANNPEIDAIFEKMHPAIKNALSELNKATKQKFEEWDIPFDIPNDWQNSAKKAFDAFHIARQAMQKKMDECIANHADQEILYDQPEVDKNKLRISGPFTVEAVPFPTVLALDEAEQPKEADVSIARSGESSRQHSWRDELLKTGIRGKGGDIMKFSELETLPDSPYLHVTGSLADSGDRVVVSFGPEHASLEQRQVDLALHDAEKLRPAPKYVVFASFEFDPEAAKDIDETKWPGVTLLKAKMNTDLLTEDLRKSRSSNQSFWLMGQPDVELKKIKSNKYQVEVHGFDYFDTKKGELISGGKNKIAMWLLDTDYDERSLFPQQVFFPMAGSKDGWNKLKKNIRAELNKSLLDKFHGTVSLPFDAGENKKIAVKIIDDRGIESLKIIPLN
ncbi:MAG: site-specific DNA-methyltransferase [Proteobacteria bacterium]|nr:site-specific DNA-methyltransferase [Pseudomonadota bacterium]